MVDSEIKEIIKKDFRQTQEFANFLEFKNFKTIVLSNKSFFHKFDLGPFTIVKSFRPNLDEKSFEELKYLSKPKSNLITKISPNYDYDESLNKKNGYIVVKSVMSPTKSLIRDLREPIDKIYESFSENTKYKINRSIREKDRIEIVQNPSKLLFDIFYSSLQKRQSYKSFITYSYEETKEILKNFGERTYLISSYDKENKLVVSNFYIIHCDKAIYFSGSVNTENKRSFAGYQMIFEAFKFFKSKGIKVYDFEGIGDERDPENLKRWSGFTDFKKKFSKEEVYFPQTIVNYYNPVFRFIKKFIRD